MYGGSVTRTVEIWGTKYEVDVQQKSKTVWVAVAEYMGEYPPSPGLSAETEGTRAVRTATNMTVTESGSFVTIAPRTTAVEVIRPS